MTGRLETSGQPLKAATEFVEGAFMGVQAPFESARFLLLPVPFERTTSYKKGAGNGPAKLIQGSCGIELWDEETRAQTYLAGIHTLKPVPVYPNEQAPTAFPKIEKAVEGWAARKDKTLFSIGGEHSISQALVPPFTRLYPGLSILHFDAHADMRDSFEGSPHNHACAMHPLAKLCPIVQVGIRSVAEEEAHYLNAGNVRTFFAHDHPDIGRLIPEVLDALTGAVYISIDLDGFDPAVIPGVGTPQPGGFSWRDALSLFKAVIEAKHVVGADVMELCPLEDNVISEIAAAKLVYRMMGYLLAKGRAGRNGAR